MEIKFTGALRNPSHVKIAAVLTVFVMAFAALAFVPADKADAVSSWSELKDAIESGGENVSLDGDIYDDSDDDAIEIKGEGRTVRIDMNGHKIDRQRGNPDAKDGRLFEVSDGARLAISNGTLSGGHGDDGGCMVVKQRCLIELENVSITNCYSDDDGGAVWLQFSEIAVTGGSFTNNACNDNGGVFYGEEDAGIYIDGATFSDNFADDDASVVYSNKSYYEIKASQFNNNHAEGNGGVIYADKEGDVMIEEHGHSYITNSVFTGNHADKNGGAIYFHKSYAYVYESTFDGNYCATYGGAIYAEESELWFNVGKSTGEFEPVVFKNNNAPDSGGSLALFDTKCELCITVHENNHANACGGAIYISDDSDVTITNATFTGNNVLMDGGAVLVGEEGSKVTIAGKIVVKDNKAERNGPNVFIRSGNKLICNKLEDGSTIGVVLADGEDKFTERFGENNPGVDPAKIFFSDNSSYYVGNDNGDARMYKSGTGGDMSDNTIWIIIGIIAAVIVIAAIIYVMKTRKTNSA
jgi:predicted outer membrane repeat protein